MDVVEYWMDEIGRSRNIYEVRAASKFNNRIEPLPTDSNGRVLSRIERKQLIKENYATRTQQRNIRH